MYRISTERHSYALPTFLAIVLAAFCTSPVDAQPFHRDCGAGRIYDEAAGACGDVEAILSRQGTLFWVDQSTGSDANPGTKSRPWKTIGRANQRGQLRPGDAVLIRRGTYREEIRPRASGQAGQLITFAAYPGETVTVSGADIVNRPGDGYSGWGQQGDGSWRHPWTWSALPSEGSPLADRRRELFVVNGTVMHQLSGTSRPSSIEPGQFWVQGTDQDPVAVYLRAPSNMNPNQQLVEVGQRDLLFQPYSRDVCTRSEDGHYRVLLLRFTHSTAKRQRMAVCAGSRGSRLEEIEAVWNNAGGIQLSGNGHLVRGAVASHNGIEGIGASGCDGCTVEHSEVRFNHWKWWQHEGGRSHGGGGKYANTTNSSVRFNTYSDNEGSGIWLDENSSGNEVYGNYVEGNLKQGIQIELHSDGNRIYNNVVTRSRWYSSIWNGIGISVSVSDQNLVAYNTVINNQGTGIRVGGDNRGTSVGTVVYNNLFLNNALAGDAAREIMVLGSGTSGTMSPWQIVQSNRVNGNAYSYRDPDDVQRDQANFMLSPSGPGDGALYSNQLGEWQAPIGFDLAGYVTNPALPTVTDLLDPLAGWKLGPGSQFAGRAVALPSGARPIRTDLFGNARPASGGSVGAHEPSATGQPPTPNPPAPGGGIVFAVNAGGQAFTAADGTVYQADDHFTSGRVRSTDEPVAGTPDDDLYRSAREGQFAYRLPVGPGTYELTLRFAEFAYDGAGQRRFDVEVEGAEVLSDVDVFAAAGPLRAHDRTVTVEVTDGDLDVRFAQDVRGPMVSALTVRALAAGPTPPTPPLGAVVFAVNAGGQAFTAADGTVYQADDHFTSGRVRSTDEPVAGTPDGDLYRSAREGQFAYRLPVGPGTYELTLRFAEFAYDGAGQRRFDVEVEGAEVLSDVDVFAAAGPLRAHDRTVTVEVTDGDLDVRFAQDVRGPMVSALTVRTASASVVPARAAPLVAAEIGLPTALSVEPAAPNPTRGRSVLRYALPERADVRVEVLDVLGRQVAVLAEGDRPAGWHSVTFDGSGLPSGVYVVRLQAGGRAVAQRLTLAR